MTTRRAGLLVPLFSIPSSRSWGIGEIGDLAPFAAWLREADLAFVQVLPLNEMAAGGQSPYSAMSAMAIDPIYISVGSVEDFRALGGAPAMGPAWQERLASALAQTSGDAARALALARRALEVYVTKLPALKQHRAQVEAFLRAHNPPPP